MEIAGNLPDGDWQSEARPQRPKAFAFRLRSKIEFVNRINVIWAARPVPICRENIVVPAKAGTNAPRQN
jgi:hypothetical protein